MPVSDQEQRAIVFLAAQIRSQLTGGKAWDDHGIAAAVARVRHLHLADVAQAALAAADEPDLDTPAAIGNTRAPCWSTRKTDRPSTPDPFDRGTTCATCSLPEHRCRSTWSEDHDFVSIHEHGRRAAESATAAARQAIRASLAEVRHDRQAAADTTETSAETSTEEAG